MLASLFRLSVDKSLSLFTRELD